MKQSLVIQTLLRLPPRPRSTSAACSGPALGYGCRSPTCAADAADGACSSHVANGSRELGDRDRGAFAQSPGLRAILATALLLQMERGGQRCLLDRRRASITAASKRTASKVPHESPRRVSEESSRHGPFLRLATSATSNSESSSCLFYWLKFSQRI